MRFLISTDELAAGMLLDQDVAALDGTLALGRGLELNAVSSAAWPGKE